jgi:thiosulfate/3-mercaptopyruvate sulfurtransferase
MTPQRAHLDEARPGPARRATFSSPTVTGDWLAAHLGSVVVADVRWSLGAGAARGSYQAGHVPGAVFVDLDRDLADPPTRQGGRHPLPEPRRFALRMGELGIGDTTPVVAYDDGGGSSAARLWWLLHALGAPVAVLDGGLRSWPGSLTTAEPMIRPARRTVRPWPADRFADSDDVERARVAPGMLVIDARSGARFADGDEAIDARPGHIPGARSAPWSDNLDAGTGLFLPRADLRRRFIALGAERTRRVIAYCGSGVTACHDLLALELAGWHDNVLYPGSWSAWAADPDRPAVTGADTGPWA